MNATVDYEILPEAECLRLLADHEVGRLGFTVGEQPEVLPVNYACEHGTIVVRTDAGTKLGATPFTRVAFEVDDFSVGLKEGWSVVVHGVAQDITTAIDPTSERLRTLPLSPWAPGPKAHWLRIVPRTITGRRLHNAVTR